MELQKKGRSEKNTLGGKERKTSSGLLLKVPLAISATFSRRLEATTAWKSGARAYIYM